MSFLKKVKTEGINPAKPDNRSNYYLTGANQNFSPKIFKNDRFLQ